ncbi:MAG: magnesium/cobalt transporter CorA [Actinomycetales bacterium]
MRVDCALYENGRRVEQDAPLSSDALQHMATAARESATSFVWLGMVDPDAAELHGVAQGFGLHPLALEDAASRRQRPKLEVFDDALAVVMRTVWYTEDGSEVDTGQLMVMLAPDVVLTARHGRGSPLSAVRRQLDDSGRLRRLGTGAVLHAVLDHVVDDYVEVSDRLEDDVAEIERLVFGADRFEDSERIYRLKRELGEFRRATLPLRDVLARLIDDEDIPYVTDELRPYLRDVADHLARVVDAIDTQDRQLGDIVSAHLAQVAVRQNEDMRKISAWVAMAAVPTLLAGIWGMNFEHMPELHWRLGYPLALLLMAGIVGALYRVFRRSGWL